MAIQDPGFWERFSLPTHHDEPSSKERVTLVQIASSSSTPSRPDLRHSYVQHSLLSPTLVQYSPFYIHRPQLHLFSRVGPLIHHPFLLDQQIPSLTSTITNTPTTRRSYLEYQDLRHKRSKRRLLLGGILLVILTTILTIIMVWLGVNGWFSDHKEAHKPQYPD